MMQECKDRDKRALEWPTAADIEDTMSEHEKQAFDKVMGATDMPDDTGPDYDAWLFHKTYRGRQREIDALKAERNAHRDNAQQLVEENATLKAENEKLRNAARDALNFIVENNAKWKTEVVNNLHAAMIPDTEVRNA